MLICRTILILLALLALPGCLGQKTIIVQPGTVVKTGKEIKGAVIFAPDKDGNLIETKGDIPAGASVVIPPNKIEEVKK